MSLTTPFRTALQTLRRHWLLSGGVVIAVSLLSYRLASLPARGLLSHPELTLATSGGDWHHLLHNPFYLPYRALAWLAREVLPAHPIVALRLPSVLIAVLALLATAYVIRRWYGPRTALFGFILVATSAAWLHPARLATTDIVFFAAIPLLLAAHVALLEAPTPRRLLLWLLVSLGLLYVPGLVWLVLVQTIWQRQHVSTAFSAVSKMWKRVLVVALSSLGLAPLAYGFFQHPNISYVLGWLGLPASVPAPSQLIHNLINSVAFIAYRSPTDPARWLSTLPLLSAFMVMCLLAGILFYGSHFRAERTHLLTVLTGISLALLVVGGPVSRSLLVPLLYIIAFGGIAYLLRVWLTMFPRNLAAKWLGIGMICLALALNVTYELRHYFVAWPHNSETRAAFRYPVGKR